MIRKGSRTIIPDWRVGGRSGSAQFLTAHSEAICLSHQVSHVARRLESGPKFWHWVGWSKELIGRPETHILINALHFGDLAKPGPPPQ